jgi:energy-coupling factor transporter ATP-binding protein EcfA2
MIVEVKHHCKDFNSYRAARVKSLFNAENGYNWERIVDLPIEDFEWKIGLVVGPSGSGKTSVGRRIFNIPIYNPYSGWDRDKPIVDCIAPDGDFNAVTGALAAVGLGDVPAWLRPFHVLSNGEKFRAGLARLICEHPKQVVIDEFTSVIDRQIAKIGAMAFAKAWRRENGQIVLLSCHYDIVEWLQPDWIYDMREARFSRDCLRRRPDIELRIYRVKGSVFKHFKPHYYLDLPLPVSAEYFVGMVENEPVCHIAVCPLFTAKAYRATRLVTMPEWQGAGLGTRFLNWVGEYHLQGNGRCGYKYPTFFHTSHPQLCAALRHSKKWIQTGATLYGTNKTRSTKSITHSMNKSGKIFKGGSRGCATGYGGHFRAVQSFKYIGNEN